MHAISGSNEEKEMTMKPIRTIMAAFAAFTMSLATNAYAGGGGPHVRVINGQQPASMTGYLKLDGIAGESADKKKSKHIEVLSWSWGAEPRNGAAGSANITLKRGFASLSSGQRIGSMTVVLKGRRGAQRYTLENVYVTSYQTAGSAADTRPTETLSLNFEKIKY